MSSLLNQDIIFNLLHKLKRQQETVSRSLSVHILIYVENEDGSRTKIIVTSMCLHLKQVTLKIHVNL